MKERRVSAPAAFFTITLLATLLWDPTLARAADAYVPFDGERSAWHDGFERYDFVM